MPMEHAIGSVPLENLHTEIQQNGGGGFRRGFGLTKVKIDSKIDVDVRSF